MNWTNIWTDLFGAASWFGLDIGFWTAMSACVMVVIVMNIVFWSMKPRKNSKTDSVR